MIGALYFGEYLLTGLASYTPSVALAAYLGGVVPGLANAQATVSLSTTGQSTAKFSVRDGRPVPFTPFKLGIGSLSPQDLIFNGEIQDSNQTYDEGPNTTRWDATAIDSSMQFNRHLVFASFTGVAADVAAKALLAAYAPDFSGAAIQANLAPITLSWQGETLDTVFAAIAQAIGGYYYRDLGYIGHLFTSETPAQTPDALNAANQTLLLVPPIQWDANVAQTRNRVLGVGASTSVLGTGVQIVITPATPTSAAVLASTIVLPGDSIVPLADVSMFSPNGGKALIGSNVINYGGKSQASPTGVPLITSLTAGTGIDVGPHWWGYTFTTVAGESLISPLAGATSKIFITPATPGTITDGQAFGAPAGPTAGRSVIYAIALTSPDNSAGTPIGASSSPYTALGNHWPLASFTITSDMLSTVFPGEFTNVVFLKNENGAGWVSISSNFINQLNYAVGSPLLFYDNVSSITYDYEIAHGGTYVPPASANAQKAGIYLPAGPTATTGRNLYRTPIANPLQPQLQQTIANNIASVVFDTSADSSLGVVPPTNDTSGLTLNAVTTTNGATAVGAVVLNLVSSTNFVNAGWVFVAGSTIRYTGRSGNQLTGIPTSGIGSILVAIPSGTQVTTTVALTGIPTSGAGSIVTPISSGASCALFSQQDNTASQAFVATIEGLNAQGIMSDGIYEVKISDSSQTTQAGLDALCQADLLLYASALGIITVTYSTLDKKSYPGRPVNVSMAGLVGTFVIQTVQITVQDQVRPVYQCVASSVRYTLDDLLRHVVL